MKQYDRVVLTVEKEKYAKEGVHRGMSGIICDPENSYDLWLPISESGILSKSFIKILSTC